VIMMLVTTDRSPALDYSCQGNALVLYFAFGRRIVRLDEIESYARLPVTLQSWSNGRGYSSVIMLPEFLGLKIKGRGKAIILYSNDIDKSVWKWVSKAEYVPYEVMFPKPTFMVKALPQILMVVIFILAMYILGSHGIIKPRSTYTAP